jgi:molybdate transport system ATP-binding protein
LFDEEGPVSVLTGRLVGPDEHGLCRFESGAVQLWIPGGTTAMPEGGQRLRILARDVTLALDDPGRISVMNRVPVVIDAIHPGRRGDCLVAGRMANNQILLAQVTAWSIARLGIKPGDPALALIKTLSLQTPSSPGAIA